MEKNLISFNLIQPRGQVPFKLQFRWLTWIIRTKDHFYHFLFTFNYTFKLQLQFAQLVTGPGEGKKGGGGREKG